MGPSIDIKVIDLVPSAAADEVLPVPATFDEVQNPPIFKSKTSAYYYKPGGRFIVDVKMATYSNTDPVLSGGKWVPTNDTGEMLVYGMPWDVPGSFSYSNKGWEGGAYLALQDDSNRYELLLSVYLKHGDGSFVRMSHVTLTSTWKADSTPPFGEITWDPGYLVRASAEGWDTYRIAVACIIRGVPQQVAVSFQRLPPK